MPTQVFTADQCAAGLFGFFDTGTSGRKSPQADRSNWAAVVTGTDAALFCGAGAPNPFWVSVDGGAFTNPTLSGGQVPLFTGLADGPHLVQIYGDSAYAPNSSWFFTGSANFLTVTGASPAVGTGGVLGPRYLLTDPAFPGCYAGPVTLNTPGVWQGNDGSVTPTFALAGGAAGSHGSTKFRAQCGSIWAFTGDTVALYGVDGGELVRVTLPGPAGKFTWKLVATGFDATAIHNYTLLTSSPVGTAQYPALGVMVGGVGATFAAGTFQRIHQHGTSITTGVKADYYCDVDLYAAMQPFPNLVAGCFGHPGATTAQIGGYFAGDESNSAGSPHAIVVEAGRNDLASTPNLASDYTSLVNSALGAVGSGGVVLARLPTPNYTVVNSILVGAVGAISDARLHLIDTTNWTGIATDVAGNDTTHPTTAGYATMAGYDVTAYGPFLAPPAAPTTLSLTLPASTTVVGTAGTATVTLSGGSASSSSIVVALAYPGGNATGPASVTVLAGSLTATFSVTPTATSYTVTPTSAGLTGPGPVSGTATASPGSGSGSGSSGDAAAALAAIGLTSAVVAQIVANLDAKVSTRSTLTAPANFNKLLINSAGKVATDRTIPVVARAQDGVSAPTEDDCLAAAWVRTAGDTARTINQDGTADEVWHFADGSPFRTFHYSTAGATSQRV